MENSSLRLHGENLESVKIELLIKILATQQATATTIIEMLADTPDETKRFIGLLNSGVERYSKEILEDLYERHGHIDTGDLLAGE